MIKTIQPDSYDFQSPVAALAQVHRLGMDRDWLVKRAGAENLFAELEGQRPKPGHSWVHLVAMGDADYYSANRNGDFFYKTARILDLPLGDWETCRTRSGKVHTKSAATFADRTEVGNLECHPSFVKLGHVFRHHKNRPDKGDKIWGEVKASAHNDAMHRVELIVELPDKDWAQDLEKIANDEPVAWSMSCRIPFDLCLAPGTPILTPVGEVPIDDLKVGDRVISHTGEVREVTDFFHRQGNKPGRSFKVGGMYRPLVLTDNHPLFVLPSGNATQNQRTWKRRVYGSSEESVGVVGYASPTFVPAEEVTTDDYALFPAPKGTQHPEVSPWLVGLFLADGSITGERRGAGRTGEWRATGARWSLGTDRPEIIDRLVRELKELGVTARVNAAGGGKKAVSVSSYGADLVKALKPYGRCKEKRVAPAAFHWHPTQQRKLLAGWLDGDGSQDPEKGSVRGVTVLEPLARDLQRLSFLAGVPAACHRVFLDPDSPDNWAASEWAYFLHFASSLTGHLSEHSTKIASRVPKRPRSEFFYLTHEGRRYLALPIREVEETSLGETFNLSVDVDESYVANLAAVHNCSACGHKAPTRNEYCDHMTYHMGDMLKSGHLVGMVNDHMAFFDISRVNRPADRIAYQLTKAAGYDLFDRDDDTARALVQDPHFDVLVASSPAATARRLEILQKLAAIEKQLPVRPSLHKLAPAVADDDRKVPPVEALAGKHEKLAALFAALQDSHTPLPFARFVQLSLGPEKTAELQPAIEAAAGALDTAFARALQGEKAAQVAGNTAYDPCDRADPGLAKAAAAAAEAWSLDPDALGARAMRRSLGGVTADLRPGARVLKAAAALPPTAANLLHEYVSYTLSYLDGLPACAREKQSDLCVLRNAVQ